MEQYYKSKYGNFFGNYLKFINALCLCLDIYLKIYSIQIKEKDLISLLLKVKENAANKNKKKLKNEFHSIFCSLIENVVANFEYQDLMNFIIDNYGLVQLSLCSAIAQWIKTKEDVVINKDEIEKIFNMLRATIKREYGEDFFMLTKIIGICDKDETKKINSPIPAIVSASNIIKNFHPNELNRSINAFTLKDYEEFQKYDTDCLKILPCEKNSFINKYKSIIKMLTIIDKMKKYEVKNRLNFFMEFKGDNQYLNEINLFLSKMNKKSLINLDNEFQDIDLIIEKNIFLLKRNKELSKNNKDLLLFLDEKNNEVDQLKKDMETIQAKADKLKAQLTAKKDELQKANYLNNDLSNRLLQVNLSLNESDSKINNHLHREICGKVENYFYYITSPSRREIIDKEMEEKKETKVNIYINNIEKEYPKYFNKIKNEGIDYSGFLRKINNFRKQNNQECHDRTKVNYNSMINTLNNYYEQTFDFKKHFDFMAKNFSKFKVYLLNENEEPGDDVYESFQKKESEC